MAQYTEQDIAKQQKLIQRIVNKISSIESTLADDTLRDSAVRTNKAWLDYWEDELSTATEFYSQMVKK